MNAPNANRPVARRGETKGRGAKPHQPPLTTYHLPFTVRAVRTRQDREANAFLESYNPLRGLTIRRAQMIFDAARRGNDVRLQWIYENIEQSDPTLMICAERRASALVDLDWTIRPKAAARAKGFDQTLADEQAAFLEQAYGQAEERNLFPAIERLASAFFRGHAHVRPLWSADGLGLAGFELLNAWNLCRDIVSGLWHWNPSASETLDFGSLEPVPEGEIVTLVRTRHIDYPAMPIFLRNALGEKAWGRFLERYGIPPVIITMPPDMDPARVSEYCAAATQVADGGSGALPAGSLVSYAHEARGTDPFTAFLDHQQRLIVLMATGGMLTSLTGATGIGQGATDAHEETWRTIVRRDAAAVATALNRTVTDALLDRAFPGRPHLAAFDFETEPAPGPAEVFDLAAKAVQAGWRVTQAELQERTGYALEPAAAGSGGLEDWRLGGLASPLRGDGPTASPMPWGVGQSRGGRATPTLNRQTSNHPSLQTSGLQGLAEALQADCAPLARALQTLLDRARQPEETGRGAEPHPDNHLPFTNYHLRREAAALAARLPDLLPEDPALASEIQTLLDETFTEGSANGESRIANREYKRDKDGRFSETQGAPAPQKSEAPSATAPKKGEALPALPDPKASPTEYRKANRTRGEAALGNILADHADVPAAMVSRKLGPIDFVWGREGNPGRGYEGGYGFSHIIAKHGEEAARRVPAILAYGKYFHDEQRAGDYLIVHQNEVVSLKRNSGNFFVVTSYEANKKATAYLRRGGQIENKAKDGDATL